MFFGKENNLAVASVITLIGLVSSVSSWAMNYDYPYEKSAHLTLNYSTQCVKFDLKEMQCVPQKSRTSIVNNCNIAVRVFDKESKELVDLWSVRHGNFEYRTSYIIEGLFHDDKSKELASRTRAELESYLKPFESAKCAGPNTVTSADSN
jgi:hypothetical protein